MSIADPADFERASFLRVLAVCDDLAGDGGESGGE
jgi:hypothetical protein